MGKLQEKITIITGAASGIGKGCAELFAQEGATVVVTDIQDEAGQELADAIGGAYLHVDVTDPASVEAMIYLLELAVVGRLFAQDPELYAEIEMQNPYSAEMRRHFVDAAGAVDQLVDQGDRAGFQALFTEVNRFFGGFSEEAMDLSDFLIDRLVERDSDRS